MIKELENQALRKKELEDNIKSILFVISLSITAITFTLNYEASKISTLADWIPLVVLTLSIFYFISSAAVAVQTLEPSPFILPQSEIIINKETSSIGLEPVDEDDDLKSYIRGKVLNDNINLRIGNSTYAAFKLLRNGLILFGLYFGAALFQKNLKSVQNPETTISLKIDAEQFKALNTMIQSSSSLKLTDFHGVLFNVDSINE